MTRLETIWLDGVATFHYVVDAHIPPYLKSEIFDNLVRLFPKSNVIVSYADGTISTHNAQKPE
jgi:hypothetical protein